MSFRAGHWAGAAHPNWQQIPSYDTLHKRIRAEMTMDECWACGTTTGPFFNSCINPTRWDWYREHWILMGNDASEYRRMCETCSKAYDTRIRNEALAEFFGVPLPCS